MPDRRLFLSTDAGGVGLNLQNASVVVNMDQPWNPAVLEQRIGRVHRLGQHRPVRVVNFVSQGTIEHGMLSVLSFKKSLFAGVLDGGQDEVFLGGTRLKRFMESVEKVTDSIPEAMPTQAEPSPEPSIPRDVAASDERVAEEAEEREERVAEGISAHRAWTDALTAGLSFLEKLGQALRPEKDELDTSPASAIVSSFVAQDKETGAEYLKLPMPKPETLQKIADLLNALVGNK